MEPKEAPGKENMGTRKKNLPFLRSRLYMLERRKTDTVVESSVPGDHSGTLRRSQSDRSEYNQKLQALSFLLFHLQRKYSRQRRKANITFLYKKESKKIRKMKEMFPFLLSPCNLFVEEIWWLTSKLLHSQDFASCIHPLTSISLSMKVRKLYLPHSDIGRMKLDDYMKHLEYWLTHGMCSINSSYFQF
ncbi:hypothetical protein FD754_022629 [Muntiacus muntjak]|uniref:Uncharacterized protein n=1 Tax=Muntiacus muntjak TaxID=9888 RepID=A0A5N3V9B3_MUNMU|nr:hypothetical protein FD754_022629 [Muntiacus muntjak]